MNYISHFYFYQKENNPYHNCGLIFPDWLSTYKRQRFNREINANNEIEENLKAGVLSHLKGDKIFHGSAFFKEHAHGVKKILERTGLNKDKLRFTFISHVIMEMMIDRILLMKHPGLGEKFYANLDACDNNLLVYFAKNNSPADDGLLTLIERFKHHRFILEYITTDRFVFALSRIAGKVGIVIDETQGKELMTQINAIEEYINENMEELYNLFKENEI